MDHGPYYYKSETTQKDSERCLCAVGYMSDIY